MNAQPRVTTYNKYETLSGESVVGRLDWQNVENWVGFLVARMLNARFVLLAMDS